MIVRLARPSDVGRLNSIANHKAIFPFMGSSRPIDFSLTPPSSLTFVDDYSFMLFTPHEQGWEFHTAILPEGRGRKAVKFTKHCIGTMFERFNAERLITFTPDDCPHARPPLSYGFKQAGRMETYVRGTGASIWMLTEQDWRRKQCQ